MNRVILSFLTIVLIGTTLSGKKVVVQKIRYDQVLALLDYDRIKNTTLFMRGLGFELDSTKDNAWTSSKFYSNEGVKIKINKVPTNDNPEHRTIFYTDSKVTRFAEFKTRLFSIENIVYEKELPLNDGQVWIDILNNSYIYNKYPGASKHRWMDGNYLSFEQIL